MITEDYVSFETAKLLKEKGFDEYCPLWYNLDKPIEGPFFYKEIGWYGHNFYDYNGKRVVSAPTLQMAMKWLRKEHKLCIVSIPVVTDDDGDGGCLWNYVISRKLNPLYKSESLYESQETALNDAIKYCLENLM